MKNRALIVVTSHSKLGESGKKTGYYLSEVAEPYREFINAGLEVDIASPQGGKPPMDERSRDPKLESDPEFMAKLESSLAVDDLSADDYDIIYFAGGHGTMWDFPDNRKLQELTAAIYENGGIVSAVCHGPAALVNVKLKNGKYLVADRYVNSYTDEEEKNSGLDQIVPFLLESKLRHLGVNFQWSPPKQEKVVTDGRLITGQNPASARGVGRAVIKTLRELGGEIRVA